MENNNCVSVHNRNLSVLAIEMFKFKTVLVHAICKEIIQQSRQNRYELRNNAAFSFPLVKEVHKGLRSFNYLGPKI